MERTNRITGLLREKTLKKYLTIKNGKTIQTEKAELQSIQKTEERIQIRRILGISQKGSYRSSKVLIKPRV